MSEPVIDIRSVSKRFGNNQVLDDVTLQVPIGQTFAFLGRNGAGKTTTIKLLLGLLPYDAGQIRVCGHDPAETPLQLRQQIGFLAEDQQMFGWMSIAQILAFIAPFYPTWDQQLALRYVRRFDLKLATRIRNLSKGQNVKLGLVLALAHNPKVVILDDPSLGLDPIARKEFNRELITHLQDESRTVFYSSHLLYEVEPIADAIAILKDGHIVRTAKTEALRDDVKRIVLANSHFDEHSQLFSVLDVQRDRIETAVVVDNAQSTLESLVVQHVQHRVIDLNLDDIFEAYVIGKAIAELDAGDFSTAV